MSTPEEGLLYEALLVEFGEVAHALGGWDTVEGTVLDGRLMALAGRLFAAGVAPDVIVRRQATVGI